MIIHPYYINKLKYLFEKIKNKIGVISPSSGFKNIGAFICYGMKAGEQAARLDKLNQKLYEPYRLPRRVYAQAYKPFEAVVFNFKYAQMCYEND